MGDPGEEVRQARVRRWSRVLPVLTALMVLVPVGTAAAWLLAPPRFLLWVAVLDFQQVLVLMPLALFCLPVAIGVLVEAGRTERRVKAIAWVTLAVSTLVAAPQTVLILMELRR